MRAMSCRIGSRWRPALRVGLSRFMSSSPGNGDQLEIWAWGKNEFGQLGIGDEETRKSPSLVTSVEISGEWQGMDGAKGSRTDVLEAMEYVSSSGKRTRLLDGAGISCGLFHSGFWIGGRAWLWGQGSGGRLGLGTEQSCYVPTALTGLTNVKSLALGGLHSVAVTSQGSLFTWGFGAFGALGHGVYTKEVLPRKLTGEDWMDTVLQASAGGSHTAAVTSSGDLYTWGRDHGDGRLGHGEAVETDEGVLSTPTKVKELSVPVSTVVCGGFYTMALTPDGQLWSWGGNSNFELGRGSRRDDWRPKAVPSLEQTQIIQVACGGYHAAALTGDGKVLTWGHGGQGQLGHGSLQSAPEPTLVESIAGLKIISVACGGAWTAAVTESGELYTWGKNRDNQLGVPGLMDTQMNPTLVKLDDTNQESSSQRRRVVWMSAGATHGTCLVHS